MAARTASENAFAPGRVVQLAPGVRRITAPNPGFMTGPGTNCYLVGETEHAIIDPGPRDEGHIEAIAAAVADRARWILVTHAHPDHCPAARPLADRLGIPVYAHATRLRGVRDPDFRPDHSLADGDQIKGADFSLRCLHTPGHAADHLCFLLESAGMLFAGDHVMEGVTVVIAPPDGDMAAYLRSLEALQAEAIECIAPAHGGLLDQPRMRFKRVISHRLEREAQVVAALAQQAASVEALTARIYRETPAPLRKVAEWQVHAHLLKLAQDGRAAAPVDDGVWRLVH